MLKTIRPITDEELERPEAVQLWLRETAKLLEISQTVTYSPDPRINNYVRVDRDIITVFNKDPRVAVLEALDLFFFEIRANRDLLKHAPVIFESSIGLKESREV